MCVCLAIFVEIKGKWKDDSVVREYYCAREGDNWIEEESARTRNPCG